MGKAFGQVTDTLTADQRQMAESYNIPYNSISDPYNPTEEREHFYSRANSGDGFLTGPIWVKRRAARVGPRLVYLYALAKTRGLSEDQRLERRILEDARDFLRSLDENGDLTNLMVDAIQAAKRAAGDGWPRAGGGDTTEQATETLTPRYPTPDYDERGQAELPMRVRIRRTAVSEAREARIEEAIESLTGEAKKKAENYYRYYTALYSAESPHWQRILPNGQYVATMFCPKPDPLGRFLLCDIITNQPGNTDVEVYLSGAVLKENAGTWADAKGLRLGAGYTNSSTKEIEGDEYNRSHTPDGVALESAGLGTVLYSAHALAGYAYNGVVGCYSDSGRSNSADAWWEAAVDRGFANHVTHAERDTADIQHCEAITDNEATYRGNEATIVDDEVCGRVTVEYSGDETEYDTLTARSVMQTGLVVFGVLGANAAPFVGPFNYPVGPKHKPFWDKTGNEVGRSDSSTPNVGQFINEGNYRATWRPYINVDGKLRVQLTDEKAEMLSRAMHGPSPVLAASILSALAEDKREALAVQYATRPDIAPLLAGNEVLKKMVGQQTLPGLGNLSVKGHSRIMGALGQAARGELQLDLKAENPLNLKPMSAKLRTLVGKYGDL